MPSHTLLRVHRRVRWTSIVIAILAMLVAPLTPTVAQAGPGDPQELWATVTDEATFDPVSGATVSLYDEAGSNLDSAVTDEFGDAGFTGLAPGTYYLSAAAAGYATEYYWDSADFAGATPLLVDTAFSDTASFELTSQGAGGGDPSIQGTVTGPGGIGIGMAEVHLYEYDADFDEWWESDTTVTDSSGGYAFSGLADGSYRLGFTRSGFEEEFWNDKSSVTAGDDVLVAAGTPATADASLAPAKQITGTVTAGGAPRADVWVSAEAEVVDGGDTYWDTVASTSTAGDGSYTLDVPSGSYRVSFDGGGSYVPEWWNNAHVEADADQVSVGSSAVNGIDAVLDRGGSITGTVTGTGTGPLAGADVTAYSWNPSEGDWEWAASATTDASGNYALPRLLGGTYRVGFQATDHLREYYADAETLQDATGVTVALGSTTPGIDAVLDRAGVITGTVSGPSGPLTDYQVSVYERDRFAASGWSRTFADVANAGSTYTVTGLEPGTYRLGATAPGMAPEYWDGAYEVSDADDIAVARNTTRTANLALEPARTVSGVVGDLGGARSGISVELQRKNTGPDGSYWEDWHGSATTGPLGSYRFDVAPGTYRLRFSSPDHRTEWWDDSATASRAQWLQVTASDTTANATLDRLGVISGTVSGPSGAVSGGQVAVYRYQRSFDDTNTFVQVRSTTTDASGNYTVGRLEPGKYRVGFRAAGLDPEFTADKSDVDLADDVVVRLNQVTDVDATLATATRQLSGTVSGATGTAVAPLAGAEVMIERRVEKQDGVAWRFFAEATTAATGAWTVPAVDGDYRVSFLADGYLRQWYAAAGTAADATVVEVAGSSRAGLDATLQRAGTIRGTVIDVATSQPIPFAEVSAFSATGDSDAFDYTGADGTFSLANLEPGSYVLSYEQDDYLGEWWNDQPTFQTADPVTVAIGATVTADAALRKAPRVSGTVTGTDAAPLQHATVTAYALQPGGGWSFEDSTSTTADGGWSMPLPAGTYRFRFGHGGGYADEWHADAPTRELATDVIVTSTDVPGIDARLDIGGTVSGVVTDPAGQPVADVDVTVHRADATNPFGSDFSAWTDEDGRYVVASLPPGSYKVGFQTFQQPWLDEFHSDKPDLASADVVGVTAATTTTVDAQLARARTISGTVTGATGQGLQDTGVSVYRREVGSGWSYTDTGYTDADGRYAVPVVAGDYRVEFADDDNRLTEWWNNVAEEADATTVTVGTADVSGIDAQLVDGARIGGTVTYPAQLSGWQSSVRAIDTATGELAGSAVVNAHRNDYLIDGLPAGSYRVEFARTGEVTPAEAQYWNGKAEHLGVGSAQTVTVGAAGTQTGVDATLVDGGRLTGLVRDGASNPLAGCRVTAFTGNGSLATRLSRLTPATGSVAVTGLTTGSYRLRVSGGECGPTTHYYDGAGAMTTRSDSAVAVAATRGATVSIPEHLVVPTAGAVTNTGLPVISDTSPEVGQTLSTTTGTWSPGDGLTFSYQWFADGVAIGDASGSTYAVRTADAGKRLSVRVTASRPNYADGEATSAETATVASTATPITNVTPPTVSDTTPEVGQTLTAGNGTWSQTSGLTFAYQWFRGTAEIAGATTRTYVAQAADAGAPLKVRVTASKSGFSPGEATSEPTSPVAEPAISNLSRPTISDTTPAIGDTLTAGDGTWSPEPTSFGYQWTADGTDIPGATGKTYPVTAADEGKVLRVRVTAGKPGFTSTSATSDPTTAVVDPTDPAVLGVTAPSVTGSAAVGNTLTASGGSWDPSDVTLAHQWLRAGAVIDGATASTYTLTPADLGHPISVQVTASKTGYTSATQTSAATAPVALGTITAPTPKISGIPKVGKTLTAKPGTSTPSAVTVKYQWLRNGNVIRGATGKKYKLTKADKGRQISVKVTRTASGYAKLVKKSASTPKVKG